MQWSLFLLILMGHSFVITCHLYEYHFVSESKTWHEAQKYCREKHTDLATAYDMTDMKRLKDSVKNQKEAWIGLYSVSGQENRMWHWSLPGVEFKPDSTMWETREPNDGNGENFENCVVMNNNKWYDVHCYAESIFICYDGKNQQNKKFHVIDRRRTWLQAQRYCRETHTDLVSGVDQLNDSELRSATRSMKIYFIGLFRDTWRWSDNSNSSFRHWGDAEQLNGGSRSNGGNKKCAAVTTSGRWSSDSCNERKAFICYKDKMVLINKNMTWVEALNYCRQKYNSLVSITDSNEQLWAQEKAKKADSPFVWLGLRYTCALNFWFWINDERVSYTNWKSAGSSDDCDLSGAMNREEPHEWIKTSDDDKFNFICSTF